MTVIELKVGHVSVSYPGCFRRDRPHGLLSLCNGYLGSSWCGHRGLAEYDLDRDGDRNHLWWRDRPGDGCCRSVCRRSNVVGYR